jgi:uncharacterized protein with GYD domain
VPKYLFKGSYNAEGVKGLASEGGSARRAAGEELLQGVGGHFDAFYFAFGPTDVYAIMDVPDHASAAAVAAAVGGSGRFSSVETVVLLTPDEMDEAMRKSTSYRPPGG